MILSCKKIIGEKSVKHVGEGKCEFQTMEDYGAMTVLPIYMPSTEKIRNSVGEDTGVGFMH
jgi:hypothetical protein